MEQVLQLVLSKDDASSNKEADWAIPCPICRNQIDLFPKRAEVRDCLRAGVIARGDGGGAGGMADEACDSKENISDVLDPKTLAWVRETQSAIEAMRKPPQ